MIEIKVYLLTEDRIGFTFKKGESHLERYFTSVADREELKKFFLTNPRMNYYSHGSIVIKVDNGFITRFSDYDLILPLLWESLASIEKYIDDGTASILFQDHPTSLFLSKQSNGMLEVKKILRNKTISGVWMVNEREFVEKFINEAYGFYNSVMGHADESFDEPLMLIASLRGKLNRL